MSKINMFDNPLNGDYSNSPSFAIDLQLFSEEGDAQGLESETPADTGETYQSISDASSKAQEFFNAAMNPEPPVSQEGQEQANNQAEELGTEQATEDIGNEEQQSEGQQNQLILGKFKSYDELAKAYANLEGFNTQTRQELAQLKQTLENQPEMPKEEPEVQVNEADLEAQKEAFLNKFYEDPIAFMNELNKKAEARAEEIAKKMVEPIYKEREAAQKQQEWNIRATQFKEAHPDMPEYTQHMVDFLSENPEIADKENAIELAYNYAKGLKYQAPKSHDELLNDPEFVQKIISNENIKNEILKATAAGIKKGNPPPVISGNAATGGKPVVTPPQEAKSFKEAGQMFLKSLGLGG